MKQILNKEKVNSSYKFWDYYRYSRDELIFQAVAHYLGISKNSILNIKEFSKTYHVETIE